MCPHGVFGELASSAGTDTFNAQCDFSSAGCLVVVTANALDNSFLALKHGEDHSFGGSVSFP